MPTSYHRRQQSLRTLSCPADFGIPIIVLSDEDSEYRGTGLISSGTMPYAEPTSPIPSPAKETSSRKGWMSPPIDYEEMEAGPSLAVGPMPGIPRRTSSNHSSSSTTPRRGASPGVSRQPSLSHGHSFVASKPMEGLPRRLSHGSGTMGVSGLPSDGGSLGLKLHPSPVKTIVPPPARIPQDPMSSVSTVDSSLPTTPSDEPRELALPSLKDQYPIHSIPFPPYEPPARYSTPGRSALSPGRPTRPTLMNSRRSSNTSAHRRDGHSGSLQMNFPQSSSASHLPARASSSGTSSPIPRPASMIRKKSGEVVKPSLKQRSMSTPDLMRQKDQSGSNSPDDDDRDFPEERSKSVRFADADEAQDGRALENVVLFLREQKVTAIGKAADPERAGQMTDTETEIDTDASDFVQFRTRRNAAARQADDDRLVMEGGSKVPRVRVDFAPDSADSLVGENVVMERIELVSDAGPLHMKGTAIVRNVSFQKWIAVRFTLDHWQTVSEVAGSHVTHIPSDTTGDEGWDRFSFSIKLEDYKRKLDEKQLLMCIRFSVDGHEWWDSNNGSNYNFTFKKATPRRQLRNSAAAAFGYTKVEPSQASLPGLRQNRVVSPGSQLNKAFGVTDASRSTGGPRSWMFPKLAAHLDGPPSRPESPPITSAPPLSFMAPRLPDVHTHLSLSKYCAPSPPQSPPERTILSQLPVPMVLSPDTDPNMSGFVAGHPATLYPARPAGHERRSSWNGESESWSSFSQALASSDTDDSYSIDGETTPVALRSRSPQGSKGTSSDSSPDSRRLSLKRSTGDLRALLTDEAALTTPPSPAIVGLPEMPLSPTPSSRTSTSESSPINTVSSDSTPDLSGLAINVDPDERGRLGQPKMLTNSYQEFLDKFCFFQSPRMTPTDDLPAQSYARPSYIPLSGQLSPNGFPFFTPNSSNSPRNTPTPTGQYDSASDAFSFAAVPAPQPVQVSAEDAPSAEVHADEEAAMETESAEEDSVEMESTSSTMSNSNITPKATPLLGNSPPTVAPLDQLAAAYGTEGLPWNTLGQQPSPSLAA